MSTASAATRAQSARLHVLAGTHTDLDGEWAADQWRAERLGVPARRGAGLVSFAPIAQDWLRDSVKRWSRFRLATGCAIRTISSGALALGRFSRFLAEVHPEMTGPAGITRPVSAHQFRHTFGTRMINAGVAQHVVQRLLGHASPNMTGHYARLHDTTIREAFDVYQATRVNIAGERVDFDPDAPTADAEWVKHNLNRIRDSLPNGYCARPAQQDCPHPNACLTCPDFQTTVEFIDIHRSQAATNRRLIEQADGRGQVRLAENLRHVQANLDRIIPALETLTSQEAKP